MLKRINLLGVGFILAINGLSFMGIIRSDGTAPVTPVQFKNRLIQPEINDCAKYNLFTHPHGCQKEVDAVLPKKIDEHEI